MVGNGHAMAEIAERDWARVQARVEDLETGQGRILAEASGARQAALKAVIEIEQVKGMVRELGRKERDTRKRLDSYSDLANEARMGELVSEVKRLRSLPRRILKWAGLVLGVCAGAAELAHRIGWLK